MKFLTSVRGLNCLLGLLLAGLGLRVVALLMAPPPVPPAPRAPAAVTPPTAAAVNPAPSPLSSTPARPPLTWSTAPLTGYNATAATSEFQQQLGLALHAGVLRKYGALLARLQLDPYHEERLLTLLYARAIAPEIAPDLLTPPSLPDALAVYERSNARLQSLLGAAKFAQFQTYAQNLPASNLIFKIDSMLTAAGAGLDPDAKAAVTEAVNLSFDAMQEHARGLSSVDQIRATMGGSATAYLTEAMVRQARPRLSELQAHILDAILAQQEARRAAEDLRLAVGASRDPSEI